MDGRFLTTDPSRAERNLYTYTRGNPVNRVDPTGLFSKEVIQKNMDFFDFSVKDGDWKHHSHWGFYALMRDAGNGSWIKAGHVDITLAPDRVSWVSREQVVSDDCDMILIGHRTLEQYYKEVINSQVDPLIWWRDTTITDYELYSESDANVRLTPFSSYTDGSDKSTYPQFKGVSIDFGELGVSLFGASYMTDLDGNPYLGLSGLGFAPPPFTGTVGLAYTEGYTCDNNLIPLSLCSSRMPSSSEIEQAITGVCYGGGAAVFTGINISPICSGLSLDWAASQTFYLGFEFGAGDGFSVVAPIGDIVGRNPSKGWRWAVDKQKRGVTLGYVMAMNGWFLP